MTPEQFRLATGVAAFVAFFSLLYLFHWQLRIWPDDRQKWAATIFIAATLLVVGQLCWTYLGGPAFGGTARGPLSFIIWSLSTGWLALTSRIHILRTLRRIEAAKTRGRRNTPDAS